MSKTLFIIRGLPGSGKSTLAARLCPGRVVAADDYFFAVDGYFFAADGRHIFNRYMLSEAHEDCRLRTMRLLESGDCAVANAFCKAWEMKPYLDAAFRAGARVVIISLFDARLDDEQLASRCLHGVPVSTIARMRAGYEHSV